MKIQDHQKIFNKLSEYGNKGRIALLDAPTGSGKSYSIIEFLCDKSMNDEYFQAFFVTDQKKNLSEAEFERAWERRGEKYHSEIAASFEKIAVLRSLVDTVKILMEDSEEMRIPSLIESPNLKDSLEDLKNSLNLYEIVQRQSKDSQAGWNDLKKAEFKFRKALANQLSNLANLKNTDFRDKEFQTEIRKYIKNGPKELRRWIYKIYPTIDIENFQIYLCTTDKFIRSYTPFFRSSSETFLFSNVIKECLIVFDEFDGTKKQIWNKSIDDALTIQVDLLVLFYSIFQNLKRIDRHLPTQLKEILVKNNKHQHFLKIAEKLNDEFKLSNLYKMEGAMSPETYVIHTPLNTVLSDGKRWYSHFVQNRNSVVINNIKENNLRFSSMLNRVSKFIKSFNRYIVNCSDQYMNLRNKKAASFENTITQMDACWTVYRAIGIEDEQIKMLMNSTLNVRKNLVKNKDNNKKIDDWHEFQKNGLELFSFTNSEQHELQTEINASFLNVTAENFLLSLSKKSLVYGLSATASIPTVLDNYDLQYLKGKLGNNLINGRDFLTKETLEEFDYNNRYKEAGIKVHSEMIESYENIASLIKDKKKSLSKDEWKKVKELDSELKKNLNLISSLSDKNLNSDSIYFRQRYMGLFESFVYFIMDKNLTSFLGLQSKLPDESAFMSEELIEKVFNFLANCFKGLNENTPKLKVISSRNGEIQNSLNEALRFPSRKSTRVYLLSAYLSIGVGQNLQHDMSPEERRNSQSILLNDSSKNDKRMKQIDIAGIYLGEVTHILAKINDSKLNFDLIKYVSQLEYLQDANELDPEEIEMQLKEIQRGNSRIPQPKGLPSREASYTKTIIQALGRMNRTFNKVKEPLVLAHFDVINSVSFLGQNPKLFSPEFNALMSNKKGLTENNLNREEVKKKNLTAYTLRDVSQLVNGLKNNDENLSKEYQRIREILLKFPTISSDQLNQFMKESTRCMQYLYSDRKSTEYSVEIKSLEKGNFEFTDRRKSYVYEISSKNSNLDSILKYPGLKELFIENGYAIRWEPNELIMNPIQNINLYQGILGEISGKFILEDNWNFVLSKFNDFRNTELFDFKVENQNVAVDFKNWDLDHLENRKNALMNVENKLKILDENSKSFWHVIVINILGKGKKKITLSGDKRILEVPGLIGFDGNLILDWDERKRIGDFLSGRI